MLLIRQLVIRSQYNLNMNFKTTWQGEGSARGKDQITKAVEHLLQIKFMTHNTRHGEFLTIGYSVQKRLPIVGFAHKGKDRLVITFTSI